MRNWKYMVVIGASSAALGLTVFTGCESTKWGNRSDPRTEYQRANDSRITSQLRQRLAEEPVYKFKGVDVKTYDGIVQLSGFVNSDQQKARAGQLAQQVAGVNRVENALTLIPPQVATPTGRPEHAPIINNERDQEDLNRSANSTNQAPPATAPQNETNSVPPPNQTNSGR